MARIVKFEDGQYGVRLYWCFGWHFTDLYHPSFSWTRSSEFFPDCKGTLDRAKFLLGGEKYKIVD